jgi:hypothetical protein
MDRLKHGLAKHLHSPRSQIGYRPCDVSQSSVARQPPAMSESPSHVSVKLNLMADPVWLEGGICKQAVTVEADVGIDVDVA